MTLALPTIGASGLASPAGGAAAAGASTVNGTTLDAGVSAVTVVAADGVTQVGSVVAATGVVTVPGALRLLCEQDFAAYAARDLKAEGDGLLGTPLVVDGTNVSLYQSATAGATSIALDGTGLRIALPAALATASSPRVWLRLSDLFDAAAYARVVVQVQVEWEEFSGTLTADHGCFVSIWRGNATPSSGTWMAGVDHQQNGGARTTRGTGQDTVTVTESIVGDYVFGMDFRGDGCLFQRDSGTSWPASPTLIASGAIGGDTLSTASALDWLDHCWMRFYGSTESGAAPNIAYDVVLKKLRIYVQDLATVPA